MAEACRALFLMFVKLNMQIVSKKTCAVWRESCIITAAKCNVWLCCSWRDCPQLGETGIHGRFIIWLSHNDHEVQKWQRENRGGLSSLRYPQSNASWSALGPHIDERRIRRTLRSIISCSSCTMSSLRLSCRVDILCSSSSLRCLTEETSRDENITSCKWQQKN